MRAGRSGSNIGRLKVPLAVYKKYREGIGQKNNLVRFGVDNTDAYTDRDIFDGGRPTQQCSRKRGHAAGNAQ